MKKHVSSLHLDEFRINFKRFIYALKLEGKETHMAFNLLYGHVIYGHILEDSQKEWVGNQFKDVLKTIGLTTIALMPGGVIVAIIIKALKMQKHITPSSFEYMLKKEDI
jgi:hypothetical protein